MDTDQQPGPAADAPAPAASAAAPDAAPGFCTAAPAAEPDAPELHQLDWTVRRRNSREWAVQMLFALEFAPLDGTMDDFFAAFWAQQQEVIAVLSVDPEAALRSFEGQGAKSHRAFAESLVEGVRQHQDEIDAKIAAVLDGGEWSMQRLGGVDRNVLRLAFYEMLFLKGTPPAVVINEAIDIAKYFSTRESGRLVNGVLVRAARAANLTTKYQAADPGFTDWRKFRQPRRHATSPKA